VANLSKLLREAPPEAQGQVKDVIELKEFGGGGFYFGQFSDGELSQARQILRAHNIRPDLRKAIEAELFKRFDNKPAKTEKSRNSELAKCMPMWDAVRSLFGKGPWKISDPEAKRNLALIEDDWGKVSR
jgi:hypothetical protein